MRTNEIDTNIPYLLPEENTELRGNRPFPTHNHYKGKDGGYVVIHTRNRSLGLYPAGMEKYVLGRVRVQGHYQFHVFHPTEPEAKVLEICKKYFPAMESDLGISKNTGYWFDLQASIEKLQTMQFRGTDPNIPYMLSEDSKLIGDVRFPTYNHYKGHDGGYVVIYARNPRVGLYGVGNGIYVMGRVRVQGHYQGHIFHPTEPQARVLETCKQYFPELKDNIWFGGDTGRWVGLHPGSNRDFF
jgi:hypothetical protein